MEPPSALLTPLAADLSELEEVEVLLSEKKVTLRGILESAVEAARIAHLIESHPNEVILQLSLSPPLRAQLETDFKKWLDSQPGWKNLKIDTSATGVRLQGSLANPLDSARALREARLIYPLVESQLLTPPDSSPTVYFQVYLLEIRRGHSTTLGVQALSSKNPDFLASAGLSWGRTLQLHDLELGLRALEHQGEAKILSNPQLAVRAPGEAELFSGGELPIRTHTRQITQVVWRQHGLSLKLKVTHWTDRLVRLQISTEVSELDPTQAHDDVPGIQSNRMSTEVDAHFQEPLLLSGLLQEQKKNRSRGIPFLSSIPGVGALFRTDQDEDSRTELVAILVPFPHPPVAPTHRVQPGSVLSESNNTPSDTSPSWFEIEMTGGAPWMGL